MTFPQPGHNLWDTPMAALKSYPHLTDRVRSVRRARPRLRSSQRTATVLWAVLCLAVTPAMAETPKEVEVYKLYAHSRLLDIQQMNCLDTLWTRESNWRKNAVNGSHYGIPQLRNSKVRGQDAFTQIDWGLRYINHRYGSPCKALKAWDRRKAKTGRGWY